MDKRKFTQYKKTVDTFLSNIKLKQLIRDTIFTIIQDGTCVWYNRSNKYIQFIDYDQYELRTMRNGKWIVEFDMSYFDSYTNLKERENAIASAPDEVTLAAYNLYKKDPTKYRYVELDINKTQVFKLRNDRNTPYGMPYCIPALSSIIHKELLERTEKALADKLTNQIIVQKVGNMLSRDGKTSLPLPTDEVKKLHDNLKKILQRKYENGSQENSSVAPLTIPDFVTIEELAIKMNIFPKEVWERIERDIYKKLGYSSSLNSGGGVGSQSFGNGMINVEKFYAIIFFIIDQIEDAINEYLNIIVPISTFNPKLWVSRMTILDKDKQFNKAKDLYLQGRGSLKYFIESAGYNFDHYLSQTIYENEILDLDNRLPVHSTSFTQSGKSDKKAGRKVENDSMNDSTDKTRSSGSNNAPAVSRQ